MISRHVMLVMPLLFGCGTTSTAAEAGETSSGDTGGSETGVPAGPFARGITLVDIRANQGAAIPIWLDGAEVPTSERAAALIHGRTTMFRAVYELAPDWEPRQINARIHIVAPDGTEQIGEDVLMIEGPADLRVASGTFRWVIPGELAVTGAQYYVELFEVDSPYIDDPATEDVPLYPVSGRGGVGFENQDVTINVVLVPVRHVFNGCDQSPVMDDAFLTEVENRLLETHPVQAVNLSVHPVGLEQMSADNGLLTALALIQDLKDMDAPGTDVQYYGVMDPCFGGQTICTGGFGGDVGIGDTTVDFLESLPRCLDRAVGLPAVDCPNETQQGADPSYPYADGKIGTYGFSVVDQSIKRPDLSYSLQSHCGNRWYSDYEWDQLIGLLPSP